MPEIIDFVFTNPCPLVLGFENVGRCWSVVFLRNPADIFCEAIVSISKRAVTIQNHKTYYSAVSCNFTAIDCRSSRNCLLVHNFCNALIAVEKVAVSGAGYSANF
jgi:hypothetical protein